MTYKYVIITYSRANTDGTVYKFSITRNVRMIRAKNCEKLPKLFTKVTAKIPSVLFSDSVYIHHL